MSKKYIFDLRKTDDIPDFCKKNLKLLNITDETMRLLNLFDIKNPLSVDEIIVAIYRLYKNEKSRAWVTSTLYNLTRKNVIKKSKVKKGYYEKI